MRAALKSRAVSVARRLGDQLFDTLGGAEWNAIPSCALRRLTLQLGLREASQKTLPDGTAVAVLTTIDGLEFIGPESPENWNCSAADVRRLRGQLNSSVELRSLELTDPHVALLNNVLLRYVTEFSAYPFQAFRTQGLRAGDTFLDIGAFRGYVTLKAAGRVGSSGTVYAVEPMSDNFRFVTAHVDANSLSNVKAYCAAMTDSDADDIDFFTTQNQGNAAIRDHLDGGSTRETVRNLSAASMIEDILRLSPQRVVASVTTNGTEMELATALAQGLSGKIAYVEICIPVIYTSGKISEFLDNLAAFKPRAIVEYPWLKVALVS